LAPLSSIVSPPSVDRLCAYAAPPGAPTASIRGRPYPVTGSTDVCPAMDTCHSRTLPAPGAVRHLSIVCAVKMKQLAASNRTSRSKPTMRYTTKSTLLSSKPKLSPRTNTSSPPTVCALEEPSPEK